MESAAARTRIKATPGLDLHVRHRRACDARMIVDVCVCVTLEVNPSHPGFKRVNESWHVFPRAPRITYFSRLVAKHQPTHFFFVVVGWVRVERAAHTHRRRRRAPSGQPWHPSTPSVRRVRTKRSGEGQRVSAVDSCFAVQRVANSRAREIVKTCWGVGGGKPRWATFERFPPLTFRSRTAYSHSLHAVSAASSVDAIARESRPGWEGEQREVYCGAPRELGGNRRR